LISSRSVLTLVTALALTSSAGLRAGADTAAPAKPAKAAQATDFTLKDVNGRTVRLSDYLGKTVVLLDFWATWCVPCEAELPHLEKLYEGQKDKGFVVLGIAMDGPETVAQVAGFARRYALKFPVLLDQETKVVGIYNPKRTAPLSILIDKKGQIFRVRSGYVAGDEKLITDDVSKLLSGS
jgi:peroxiredoxin